jgi:hypothetical protein
MNTLARGKVVTMPVAGHSPIWHVEVQLPAWRTWRPSARRRLRQALAADPEVVRVCEVTPLSQRLLLRSIPPTVKVDLLADSPGAAYRSAEEVVTRSLTAIGRPGPAIPWIVGTNGDAQHPPPVG